jgi:hypothetical protein
MASFIDPQNGDLATAEHVAQLVEDFQGLRNVPLSVSGINDAASYALTLKNAGTNSRGLIVYAADGSTVLLQVDGSGVLASASGGPAGGIVTNTPGSISNSMLGADVARDNLLTNGGFEIWQRGNGPFTATGTYTADRWIANIAGDGDAVSVAKDTTHCDVGSRACAAVTYTRVAGSMFFGQIQTVPDGIGALGGRTVSASFRVRATAAVRLDLYADGSGGGITSGTTHSGGGAYETLTVTKLIPSDFTYIWLRMVISASTTLYVDNANLVVGSQAANYVPMHPADDLARCLRYYEVVAEDFNVAGYGGAASVPFQWYLNYKARKAVAATLTKVGTWTVPNCAQPTIVGVPSISGFNLGTVVTAVGTFQLVGGGAGGSCTAESNP